MEEIEKKLWSRVRRYSRILKIVPFLRMVAVCNNLAFGKVTEKSDIDLFIVARNGRLFIVRTFVTALLQFLGVRRHGNKIAGRFCLSFFVDDGYMDLSKIALRDDIYLAYWIKSLKPVVDDGVSREFFSRNEWISHYFDGNILHYEAKSGEIRTGGGNLFKKILEWMFGGKSGDFIEKKLEKWQLKRAENKKAVIADKSGLLVTEHVLKFHNVDRRMEYSKLWRKKFGSNKITEEKFKELILN